MAKHPVIGYFWDYQNVSLTPEYQQGVTSVRRLRNLFGTNHSEKEFVAVMDTRKDMKDDWKKHLADDLSEEIEVLHVSNRQKNSADRRLISRMNKFAEHYGHQNDCVAVLITGDKDFGDIIRSYQNDFHIKVVLLHGYNCSAALLGLIPEKYNFYDLLKEVIPVQVAKDPTFVNVEIFLQPLTQPMATRPDAVVQPKLQEIFPDARHVYVDPKALKASLQFDEISDAVKYFGFSGEVLGYQIHLYFPECHEWRIKGQCALKAHCPKAHLPQSNGIKVTQPSFDEFFYGKTESSQPDSVPEIIDLQLDSTWVNVVKGKSLGSSRSSSVEPYRIERNNVGYETPNVDNWKILYVRWLGPNGKLMAGIGKEYKGAFSWKLTTSDKGFFLNFTSSDLAEGALNDLEKRRNDFVERGIFMPNSLTAVEYKPAKRMEEKQSSKDPNPLQVFVSSLTPSVTERQLKEIARNRLSGCNFSSVIMKKGSKSANVYLQLNYAFFNFSSVSGTAKAKAVLIELYDEDIQLSEPQLFTVASIIN